MEMTSEDHPFGCHSDSFS